MILWLKIINKFKKKNINRLIKKGNHYLEIRKIKIEINKKKINDIFSYNFYFFLIIL